MPHFWTFIYLPPERVAVRKCVLSVEDQPICDTQCNSPWCQRVQRHFPPPQDLRCFKTVSSIILLTAHWYPGMIVKKDAVLSTPSLSLWQLVQTSVEVLSCAATCINTIWGYSNTDINVLMPKIYTYCIALKTLLPNIFMTPRRMWMMPTLTYALWSSKLQRTASRGAEKAPTYLAGTRNTRYTPLPRLTKRKLKKATNCWMYLIKRDVPGGKKWVKTTSLTQAVRHGPPSIASWVESAHLNLVLSCLLHQILCLCYH